MSHQVVCPECGKSISIDDSAYAQIVSQVRNAEFAKEIKEREKQITLNKEKEMELLKEKAKADKEQAILQYKQELASLQLNQDKIISNLKNSLVLKEQEKKLSEQGLKEKYEAAPDDDTRRTIEQAARWGLAALDNREEAIRHDDP